MTDRGSSRSTMRLRLAETGEELVVAPSRLVIAGYTGRDESAVAAHIEELAAFGIPPPETVPAFYEVDPALLTTGEVIETDGAATSGEVEPVLIRHAGRYYLGVGSDHTDRDMERTDIATAKAACPKLVGPVVVGLPGRLADFEWDSVGITSSAEGQPYQRGSFGSLLRPETLLERLVHALGDVEGDHVVFAGTVPLLSGGFIPAARWWLELRLPDGATLTHVYEARTRRA